MQSNAAYLVVCRARQLRQSAFGSHWVPGGNYAVRLCRSPAPQQPTSPSALPCPLQTKFRQDQHCTIVCRLESLTKAQEKAFKSKIGDEYRVNM